MELKDKTYLVTGGTSGVGKAIASGIAKKEANVVIVSRSTQKRATSRGRNFRKVR